MKNRKFVKPLLIVVAMILVCVLTVFATIAYLTGKSNVATNTFTVGDVQITLDEAKVDVYGVKDGNVRTSTGNEYKLLPAHTYDKDPTVYVTAGSEKAYVRMFVAISDIADVKAAFGSVTIDETSYFLPQNFVQGWDGSKWVTTNKIVEDNGVAYYEFRYYTAVDALEADDDVALPALFTSFTVPGGIDNDTLDTVKEMQIKVVAQAIQADGFDTADAAFDAQDNLDGVAGLSAAELAAFFVAA